MPIGMYSDEISHYYQWGGHGHKYRFVPSDNPEAMKRAEELLKSKGINDVIYTQVEADHKAHAQAAAAHAHGYTGH